MHNPRYSIIVPVYKTQAYIRQCLDSIRAQTYENFEAVLVDDGSPDRCGEICDEYAAQDARFRVIHKENGGSTSARKAGAEVCTGDYVICVDSDDYIADDLLERLTAIIAEHEPDVVCYDAYQFSPDGMTDVMGAASAGLYTGEALSRLADVFVRDKDYHPVVLYSIWSKAVRRTLYAGFQKNVPDELVMGEDLAVTGPLFTGCKSFYVSGYQGYYYRANPTSIMHTLKKNEVMQIEILARYLKENMRPSDHRRIDGYVLMSYFGFLHHLTWASKGYAEYISVVKETYNEYVQSCIQNADASGGMARTKVVFYLAKRKRYGALWLLSHLQRRK